MRTSLNKSVKPHASSLHNAKVKVKKGQYALHASKPLIVPNSGLFKRIPQTKKGLKKQLRRINGLKRDRARAEAEEKEQGGDGDEDDEEGDKAMNDKAMKA